MSGGARAPGGVPFVAVDDLSVSFGSVRALDGVSFTVPRGSLVGVVGAAASGKSVLLKCLCLLQSPTTGAVSVDGVALAGLSRSDVETLRRRIGFAFQNLALFDRLDTVGNVAFPLERSGLPRAEARARATAELQAVGLGQALSKFPHELSGGMKRRLALARATVARPELGLFDDPFVGLDPVACARISRLIQRAHAQAGGVTLVAAGDPAPLVDVVDRLLLLEGGRLVADLSPSEFSRASDPAVQRYLGEAA